jgi:Domain of unknown function (DUF4381)
MSDAQNGVPGGADPSTNARAGVAPEGIANAAATSLVPAGSSGQLGSLQELPLPAAVSYAPQTIGWALIAAILLAAALLALWAVLRRRRRQRYRRLALKELAGIEASLSAGRAAGSSRVESLAAIPRLLKRTSLAAAPREQVAALSGDAWLAFLRRTQGTRGRFDETSAALLAVASYAPADRIEAISEIDAARLIEQARDWIEHHHVEI